MSEDSKSIMQITGVVLPTPTSTTTTMFLVPSPSLIQWTPQ